MLSSNIIMLRLRQLWRYVGCCRYGLELRLENINPFKRQIIEYGEGKSREYQKYSQLGGKRKKITQKSDEKIKDKRKDNFSKGGSGL